MVKKKFPKKEGVTFRLVHRSQHDPAVVDENAPQRILVPVNMPEQHDARQQSLIRELIDSDGDEEDDDNDELGDADEDDDSDGQFGDADDEAEAAAAAKAASKKLSTKARPQGIEREEDEDGKSLAYRLKYGLTLDGGDDYDYSKHMKTIGKTRDAVFVDAAGGAKSSKADRVQAIMSENPDAFASTFEEDVGLLHRDLSPGGIRPDWDPEIVEALEMLEDDGTVDNDWVMEDDFVEAAAADPKDGYSYEAGADPSTRALERNSEDFFGGVSAEQARKAVRFNSDDDFGSSDDDEDDREDAQTTRSRFTEYSMTSSVNFRSRGLQGVDEQFEHFYSSYDDEHIGELDNEQVVVLGGKGDAALDPLLDEFMKEMTKTAKPEDVPEGEGLVKHIKAQEVIEREEEGSESEEEEIITMPISARAKADRWDCESIISTYSNVENRPKIIDDRSGSRRNRQRKDLVDEGNASAAGDQNDDDDDGDASAGDDDDDTSDDDNSSVAARVPHARRPKKETKEERRARKNVVKEEKLGRRLAKKQTKVLFKEEGDRQTKLRLDRKKNIQGFNLLESM